jgi:DNA-binding transcriptional LysR family regulator
LAGRLPGLFSQIDYLTETVKGASTGGTGLLRIGDAGVLTTEVIAPALRRLRKHWPNLRLSAVQNTSEGFFHDLLENRIDCAVATAPTSTRALPTSTQTSVTIAAVSFAAAAANRAMAVTGSIISLPFHQVKISKLCLPFGGNSCLIANPLHILEQYLLTTAVIEFRGPTIGVAGDPLSGLQSAVVFQKIRDAGGPE